MKNKFIFNIVALLAYLQISCAQETTTTVTVVDESGFPIEGATVGVTYALRYGENIIGKGISNAEGKFEFTGESYQKFYTSAKKEGYYDSRGSGVVYTYDRETKSRDFHSPEIQLMLKEIKNPIPMYARAGLEFVIPEPNKEFGFDLEVADWVAPDGKGKSTDIIFSVNGYYNGLNDNESRLVVSFPNEGDGLIEIGGNYRKGSKLMSPHVAPEEEYTTRMEWSKSRKENPDATAEAHTKYLITEDYQPEGVNYLFRVRTVLDSQGNVVSAHYGKIYGDFKFFGAHKDGSFVAVDALYFNPKANDRNLEYDVGENLVKDLKSFKEPRLP